MSHITTDVEKIQNAVSEMAGDLLKEGLTVVGLVGRPVHQGLAAGPALAGRHAARVLPAGAARPARCARRSETSLRRWRDISEILQETISGFRVVKAFGMEGFETARFRRAASRLFHVNMRITRTTAVLPPLMEAVGGLALVGALFYGSDADPRRPPHHRRLHRPSWPRSSRCTRRSSGSRALNATLQGALAAGGRIFEVLDTPPRGAARRRTRVRAAAHAARRSSTATSASATRTAHGARAAPRLLHARGRARWWPSWARAGRARRRS